MKDDKGTFKNGGSATTINVVLAADKKVTIPANVTANVYIGTGETKDGKTTCTYDENTKIVVTKAGDVTANVDKSYTTTVASGIITVTEGSSSKVYSALTSAIDVGDGATETKVDIPSGAVLKNGLKVTTTDNQKKVTEWFSFDKEFKVGTLKGDNTLKLTIKTGETKVAGDKSATGANWSGTLTIGKDVAIESVNIGDLKTSGAVTISADVSLYGKLALGGDLTVKSPVVVKEGASIEQGSNDIVFSDSGALTIASGAKVTAKLTVGTGTDAKEVIALDGVVGANDGLTLTPSTSTQKISGDFKAGTVTLNALNGATAESPTAVTIDTGLVVGQKATVSISKDVTLTNSTSATITVFGKVSGQGKLASVTAESVFAEAISGHILCEYDTKEPAVSGAEKIVQPTDLSSARQIVDAFELGYTKVTSTASEINESIAVPENGELTFSNSNGVAANAGVTVSNNGKLDFTGKLTLNGDDEAAKKDGAVLKNSGELTATGGIDTKAGSKVVNDGEFTIKTSSTIIGSFENNKTLNIGGATAVTVVTIGSYKSEVSSKTEFENNGTITLAKIDAEKSGHSFAVAKGCTFINNGVIDSQDKDAAITGAGTFDNGAEGDVGVAVNTAKVTGVTKTLTVSDDMTQKNTYMSFQTLQILAGSSLNLTKVADITVNGKFIIDGDLTIYGKLTIGAANADAKSAEIVVNGKITVAEGGQLVIGNTIVNGENTTYGAGKLSVADTGSVTVDKGGKLTLINGKTDIKGDLTMAAGSELASSDVALAVSGTANLNGYIDSTVIVENKGTVTVDNGANEARSAVTDKSGFLTIQMAADKATVVLKSFLFENENTVFSVTDLGMIVYENEKKGEKVSIPESNYDLIAIGFANAIETAEKTKAVEGDLTFVQSASYKTVTVKDAEGKDQSEKALTYSIDVSGAISGAFTYDSSVSSSENFQVKDRVAFVIQSAGVQYFENDSKKAQYTGGVAITGELAIDEYVSTVVSAQNGGVLKVSGTVKNNASGAQKISVATEGTVTVTGEIVSSNQIDVSSKGKVNAVYYTTTIGTGKDKVITHYYTTLDKAIAGVQIEGNTADKIVKIIGTVTLTEDVTLPAAVKMQFFDKDSFLYIGTSDERAKLTAEAEITAKKQIDVKGTLTFTDKTKDKTTDTVSDVMYESADANGFRTYTNIYTAIEDAGKSAEATEIKVTKDTENGDVELDRNLTIPSNVTLVVGDDAHNAGLLLKDGVTLTVDGTLKTSQDILAETRFAINALDVEDKNVGSSAVVVNGALMFSDDVAAPVYGDGTTGTSAAVPAEKNLTASAPVYGAYYAIEGWNVVSNVDAALKETKITSPAVTINGPVVGSDVTVTPNDNDFKTVVVPSKTIYGVAIDANQKPKAETSLTVTSMTLAKDAVLDVDGKFTGSVVVGDAAVTAAKVSGLVATNDEDALVVAGTVTAAKGASFEVSKGTVVLGAVKEGENTIVFSYAGASYIDGSETKYVYMSVAAGATAKAEADVSINYITVDGTLEVSAAKTVNVDLAVVNGTVAVAKATDSSAAGKLVAGILYIGMVESDYTAASAAVTGPVTVNDKAFVKADATLEQDMSDYKSTQFYNNGALWFTAYANGDKTVTVSKAPIENAVLLGWAKEEGGKVVVEADKPATIGADSKLYSVVETEIYNVIIKADKGLSDIYLKNGSQETKLVYTQVYDAATKSYYLAYTATVAAGTYTVEYKLENGWSGEAKLTGNGVSGMTFQAAGTPENGAKSIDIVLQLTGVEKSGYAPAETTEEKDDGMTVTDYLLIVLVVLIVILAVIVALRLMRS